MKRSPLRELGYVPVNVARYFAYTENRRAATLLDACWALRVTMQAILALPNPGRDLLLQEPVKPRHDTH